MWSPPASPHSDQRVLAFALKAADREVQCRINELLRPHEVPAVQADAIDVIGDAGPHSLTELSELLVAESGHPSRLVDRLVEAGLVSRRTGAVDRRRIELSPSMSLPAWVVQDADQRGIALQGYAVLLASLH